MRKIAFTALLFLFVCFQLFSQQKYKANANIYVPPVTGYGTAEDNAFFYNQVSYEVALQYHNALISKRGSQYSLKGRIEPYTGEVSSAAAKVHIPENTHPVPPRAYPRVRNEKDRREFFSWEVDGNIMLFDSADDVNVLPPSKDAQPEKFNPDNLEFIFYLALVNNKSDAAIGEQYLIYKVTDNSVSRLVSVMVENLLSLIPVNLERLVTSNSAGDDGFRDKWLYVDASMLWAPRLYSSVSQSISWLNFGAAVTAEFHFLNFLSISAGVQVTQDWVVVHPGEEEYKDLILEIPFTVRYVIKPGDNLMIEPYAGVFANLSIKKTTDPSLFSLLLGCQVGIDMGPGMFVIDPRFALDFFESGLDSGLNYRRYLLQIGIGYKFGFFSK